MFKRTVRVKSKLGFVRDILFVNRCDELLSYIHYYDYYSYHYCYYIIIIFIIII